MKLLNLILVVGISLTVQSFQLANGAASDYLHICHRNETTLSSCVLKTLQELVLRLASGIPELGVPSINPFHFDRIPFKAKSDNSGTINNLTNVRVWGLTGTEVTDVVAKLSKRSFLVHAKMRVPKLRIKANYEMDTKILFLNLKAKGPLDMNATNVQWNMISKHDRIQRNGKEYLQQDALNGTMEFQHAHINLQGLFKDPVFTKATNDIINENVNVLFDDIKPYLMKELFRLLAGIGSKVTDRFTVNELLPK